MGIRLRLAALRRRLRRRRLEATARARGERFWCASLAGDADHSLSILCDMAVTCCCEDHTSASTIGDLCVNSLEECMNSEAARRLKHQLAAGYLPLLNCVTCRSLRRCTEGEAGQHELEHGVPRRDVLIENTVLCNISCEGCPRLHAVKLRKRATLTDGDVVKIAADLGSHGVEQISFLSSGEPFLPNNVWDQVKVLRSNNPKARIVTSTNGQMLDSDTKREAALLLDEILFSVHGCTEEDVARYQKGSSFERAYANMRDLAAYRDARGQDRPVLEWKYLLFNWNDRKETILKAVDLARKAGIDRIMFWPTTRPLKGVSWRWYLGRFLRNFGNRGSKGMGREVSFPKEA